MDFINAIEVFKGAWPTIQPAISTICSAVIATLFIRKNTSKTEIEKIKQSKFSDIADLLLAEGHITHLEYYKCRNFVKIAKKADEVYRKVADKKEPIEKLKKLIDFDWFVRFFEDSGNISDEAMQDLWASVLAGEVKKPGSFSRRALDVLRNLSQEDAKLFQEIAQYIIPNGEYYYIYNETQIFSKYGVHFSMILQLDNCGLMSSQLLDVNKIVGSNITPFLFYTDEFVCRINPLKEDTVIKLPAFFLTRAGLELHSIIATSPKKEFLIDVINTLNDNKPYMKGLTVTLHKINYIANSVINHEEQPVNA